LTSLWVKGQQRQKRGQARQHECHAQKQYRDTPLLASMQGAVDSGRFVMHRTRLLRPASQAIGNGFTSPHQLLEESGEPDMTEAAEKHPTKEESCNQSTWAFTGSIPLGVDNVRMCRLTSQGDLRSHSRFLRHLEPVRLTAPKNVQTSSLLFIESSSG
jgi:hypothetical protein